MFLRNPLEDKLQKWGEKSRVLPGNSSVMKEKVLQSIKTSSYDLPKTRSYRWVWGTLSGAVAVFVIFIGQQYVKDKYSAVTYNSGERTTSLSYGPSAVPLSESGSSGEVRESDLGIQSGTDTGLSQKSTVSLQDAARNTVGSIVDNFSTAPDTREFLKYNFYANLKTRKVQQTSERLQTIVRGHGGRVDNISVNEKFGSINFIVPKISFEAFRSEVKSLVHVKFYEESIRGQNLLPEKVEIENSTETAKDLLNSLETELSNLEKNHAIVISNLQKQLNGVAASINKLRREVTTSTVRKEQIKRDLSRLYGTQASLQKQIAQEHQNFNTQEADIEFKIKETKLQIIDLSKQDTNLLQNVETVEGRIEVQWVSGFKMMQIYCPYYWVLVIAIILLALLFNHYSKRRVIKMP